MRISRLAGRPSVAGFTLIEVMITVAIIAILAAIAIPNYSDYVTRSKIIDGTTRMGDVRTQMEKYFFDNRTYSNAGVCGAQPAIIAYSADPASDFTMTCPPGLLTATTYTLQVDGRAARGMAGFRYTVDQANQKVTVGVPAGWAGAGNLCWVLKKDGSC